jgi:hypothetical protein
MVFADPPPCFPLSNKQAVAVIDKFRAKALKLR